jgi:hypothetical protein
MMAIRPILFSAPMSRALLDGTKVQTRRMLDAFCEDAPVIVCGGSVFALDENEKPYRWPRTKSVGDLLWVREHWRTFVSLDDTAPRDLYVPGERGVGVMFIADGGGLAITRDGGRTMGPREDVSAFGRLRMGMHLPRWASRTTLEVTDVRVERLQDISEADAIGEGMHFQRLAEWAAEGRYVGAGHKPVLMAADGPSGIWEAYPGADCGWRTAREAYRQVWTDINGPGSWDANPWVVAISFGVHRDNVDTLVERRASIAAPAR